MQMRILLVIIGSAATLVSFGFDARAQSAGAGTDGGHQGATLSFAPGHPEKVIDFRYRAAHEMTVTAKALIAAFYGSGPRYSY